MTPTPKVILPARAKLNLDLHVAGRRDDGFHELRTTFQAIDLHDLLEITTTPGGETALTTSGLEIPDVGENAVLQAHRALEKVVGRALPAHFRLHKRIPPGSGMGGASSDAAAALRGLKSLHRLEVDLRPVAMRTGADVAFFLSGGRAEARGRGDVLTQLPSHPDWFAIAWPGVRLSTAAVYKSWDDVGGEPPNDLRRAAERVEPRLKDFATLLAGVRGPEKWQLTGSGSAFFRRCESQTEATEVAAALTCWTAVSCAVDAWG